VKLISKSYKEIFSEYYADKAERRFSVVRSYSQEFVDHYPVPIGTNIGVSDVALESFITSYFLDVIKFKEYHFRLPDDAPSNVNVHEEKCLNPSKVAAFSLKWLLKFHPIYVSHSNFGEIRQKERISLSRAPFILSVNISLKLAGIGVEEIPHDQYRKLVYHARFRNIDERSLILYFDALHKQIFGTLRHA